jgi:MFS family permease
VEELAARGVRAAAGRYRSLLGLPGARGPVLASALGSMPIGMFGLSILLLMRDATGSFGQAGRVVAAFGLANALGALGQGRLMDRLGQPRVLRVVAPAHALALVALVVAADAGAPVWALAVCAAWGGACLPQLPGAMRSLWGVLAPDPAHRQAAYALVAIVFEVSVVTAPAIVAGLAALLSPASAVLVAAALATAGAVAFATTDASRRWRGERHATGWAGPLAASGMRTVFAVLLAFGAAVGVVQVALPAFAAQHGSAARGGLLLAALSAGSLVGGLVYGARRWPGAAAARLVVLMLAVGGGYALLALPGSFASLLALLPVVGALLAPTTVVGSVLLDSVAPAGTATEAFGVMIMGIVAGTAIGNALGGALADGAGYPTAVVCASAIAVVGAGCAAARRRTLGR